MRVHTAWLRAVIESIPGALNGGPDGGLSQVFETKAEYESPYQQAKLTYPYWVIHPADGTDTTDRFNGPKLIQHPRFTVWTVGEDADQAADAAEKVKALLVVGGRGVIPTIEGEISYQIRYSVPLPIQSDKNATPPICYHVAEIGFDSELI